MRLRAAGLGGLVAIAAAGLAAAVAASAVAAQPSAPASSPTDAADRAVLQKVCGRCHSLEVVLDTPRSDEEWRDTIQTMVDRGAKGSDDDFDAVVAYLRAHVTTINVNTAEAEDLEDMLGVSPKTAEAIVARRQAHPFKDLGDLETVPGVDARALEAKRKLIFF